MLPTALRPPGRPAAQALPPTPALPNSPLLPAAAAQVGPDSDGLLNLPPATQHPEGSAEAAAAVAALAPGEALDEVQLPPRRLDLQRLLDSVGLGDGMPEASVPAGIKSAPKPFQLQVRRGCWGRRGKWPG
jgi:hypothetical protein